MHWSEVGFEILVTNVNLLTYIASGFCCVRCLYAWLYSCFVCNVCLFASICFFSFYFCLLPSRWIKLFNANVAHLCGPLTIVREKAWQHMIDKATSLERSQKKHQINHPQPHVYQSWIHGRALSSMCWDNRPDMPMFAFFSQKYKNKQTFLRSYSTYHHRICIRCSHSQCTSKLLIAIPIFQSVSKWQRDKENFSAQNANFPTFVGCHGNVHWVIAKCMQNLSRTYIALQIPEKLVKIRPVVPENSLLRGRPLKIKEKPSATYIACRTGMAGRLNKEKLLAAATHDQSWRNDTAFALSVAELFWQIISISSTK